MPSWRGSVYLYADHWQVGVDVVPLASASSDVPSDRVKVVLLDGTRTCFGCLCFLMTSTSWSIDSRISKGHILFEISRSLKGSRHAVESIRGSRSSWHAENENISKSTNNTSMELPSIATYQREQSNFEPDYPTFAKGSPLGRIGDLGDHQRRCMGVSNQTRTLHEHSCSFWRGLFPARFHEAVVLPADTPFPVFGVPSYQCGSN